MVAHEVPLSLKINDGPIIHAEFELDGRCEVDILISDAIAEALGLNQLGQDHFKPYVAGVAGGGSADLREYQGIVTVSFITGRNIIRSTNCANALVGGNDNLLGLPAMSRLRLGVPDGTGTICIFPLKPRRI